jgi:hypothetical protein
MIHIFVEGKADKKFINDFVIKLGYKNTDFVIDDLGGKDGIIKQKNKFFDNAKRGILNVVIFDANGDAAKRRREINKIKEKIKLEFELFLIPNDKDKGNLETLLENIIQPENKVIFDCFEKYQDCLEKENRFNLPNNKAKIFAYLEALEKDKETFRIEKRDYTNKKLWNLDNEYLNPLKDFLNKNMA